MPTTIWMGMLVDGRPPPKLSWTQSPNPGIITPIKPIVCGWGIIHGKQNINILDVNRHFPVNFPKKKTHTGLTFVLGVDAAVVGLLAVIGFLSFAWSNIGTQEIKRKKRTKRSRRTQRIQRMDSVSMHLEWGGQWKTKTALTFANRVPHGQGKGQRFLFLHLLCLEREKGEKGK